MILNDHDRALLIALRRGNHFKANPGDVTQLLHDSVGDVGPSEGRSSARRLHADGLAVLVDDAEASGKVLLRITDSGIAFADNLIKERQPKTWKENLASVPRSDWIAIFAVVVSFIALFKGD